MTGMFDEFSKTLARDVPRRDALRLLGGSLAGAALGLFGRETAFGSPSPCAVYCANFHGAAHAQCLQVCKACGSDTSRLCSGFSAGGPGPVTCCPGPGPVTCCSGPNGGVTCCQAGTSCCGGFPGGNIICCPSGSICCSGPTGAATCCAAPTTFCCGSPSGSTTCCDSPQHCCTDASGNATCCSGQQVCCGLAGCCPTGQVCCFDPTTLTQFCGTPGMVGCPGA